MGLFSWLPGKSSIPLFCASHAVHLLLPAPASPLSRVPKSIRMACLPSHMVWIIFIQPFLDLYKNHTHKRRKACFIGCSRHLHQGKTEKTGNGITIAFSQTGASQQAAETDGQDKRRLPKRGSPYTKLSSRRTCPQPKPTLRGANEAEFPAVRLNSPRPQFLSELSLLLLPSKKFPLFLTPDPPRGPCLFKALVLNRAE